MSCCLAGEGGAPHRMPIPPRPGRALPSCSEQKRRGVTLQLNCRKPRETTGPGKGARDGTSVCASDWRLTSVDLPLDELGRQLAPRASPSRASSAASASAASPSSRSTSAPTLPDGRVIAPTGKAFDVEFGQTSNWDGDQLIVNSGLWEAASQAKQLGLAP